MSAGTVPTPTTANGAVVSAVEYVRALSDDEKEHVLIALLRELIEVNGGGKGLIPIDTPEGESLGYYVPPLAAAEEYRLYGPQLTEEEEQEIDRRIKNPQPAIPAEEVIAEFRARLAEIEKQRLGDSVSPKGSDEIAERELPKLSPEREKELADRLTRLDTAIPAAEVIAELRQRAEQAMREADPAYIIELRRRSATTEQSMSMAEVLRLLALPEQADAYHVARNPEPPGMGATGTRGNE